MTIIFFTIKNRGIFKTILKFIIKENKVIISIILQFKTKFDKQKI